MDEQVEAALMEAGAKIEAMQREARELRKDAERYRWLRDKGSKTWVPFTGQWKMDAEHCDAAIDNEMAVLSLDREAAADDLYNRLHSLSKAMESSGRIDEHEHPDAYGTILDAMNYVQVDLGA